MLRGQGPELSWPGLVPAAHRLPPLPWDREASRLRREGAQGKGRLLGDPAGSLSCSGPRDQARAPGCTEGPVRGCPSCVLPSKPPPECSLPPPMCPHSLCYAAHPCHALTVRPAPPRPTAADALAHPGQQPQSPLGPSCVGSVCQARSSFWVRSLHAVNTVGWSLTLTAPAYTQGGGSGVPPGSPPGSLPGLCSWRQVLLLAPGGQGAEKLGREVRGNSQGNARGGHPECQAAV